MLLLCGMTYIIGTNMVMISDTHSCSAAWLQQPVPRSFLSPGSSRDGSHDSIQEEFRKRRRALRISNVFQALKRRLQFAKSKWSHQSLSRGEGKFLNCNRFRRARFVARCRNVTSDWDRSGRLSQIGLATVVEAGESERFYFRA